MILAVISYPYHYHITQLTIKHALANVDGITDVKVIWDDSFVSPPIDDYIPFSKIVSIPTHIKGWYAQQIIKLNLHRVLNGEILIMDGDVVLNSKIDPQQYFYAPLLGSEISSYSKINDLLLLQQYDFLSTRFMYVQPSWLTELHNLNTNINEYYCQLANSNWSQNGRWPISEWELIHSFVTKVKGINKDTIPFEFNLLDTVQFEKQFSQDTHYVLEGKDNFAVDFYQKHSISINETLWKQLYGPIDYRLGR